MQHTQYSQLNIHYGTIISMLALYLKSEYLRDESGTNSSSIYCSWCLPQPASCCASIAERAQWPPLSFLRAQWLRLAFLRTQLFCLIWLVWYNTRSVWSNCMLINANTMASVKTKLNLLLYLVKISKIKVNGGQTADRGSTTLQPDHTIRTLDHITCKLLRTQFVVISWSSLRTFGVLKNLYAEVVTSQKRVTKHSHIVRRR